MQYRLRNLIMGIFLSCLLGCAGIQSPLATVSYVDLERFMGDWYVIASIPTFVEKGAHNAVEKYALNADGSIQTVGTDHCPYFLHLQCVESLKR